MRYLPLLGLPLLLLALSCNDNAPPTATTANASFSPTPSPAPTKDKGIACDDIDFPTASLVVDGVSVPAHREAIDWNDPAAGCAINAHPFDTLILPATAIPIPTGATPNLNLTRTPTTISASAWTIDIDQLTSDYQDETVEVANYAEMRRDSRVSLNVQPTATQPLDLTALPPGDTIIQVSASWTEGTIDVIFRALIPSD